MNRVTRLVVVFLVTLLVLGFPRFSAHGQAYPALVLAPNAVAPGGETILSSYGFPDPGPLPNLIAVSETNTYDLGPISVDGSGQIHTTLVLPADMVPDTYEVLTFFGPDVNPVTTTLTVLPALTLSMNPAFGKPGAVITFTLNYAAAGQLRLDYAGAPVFGPSAIGSGIITGTFVVPGDRPNPIGSVAALTATNFVAGRVFGRAYSTFQSQAPTPPPTYNFSNVIINAPQTTAGDPFTVTGQIVPAPIGPLANFKLKALWQTTSAKTLLLNTSASLQGNGNFQLIGKLPSLFYGDPASASTGDVLSLGLYNANDVQLVGSIFGLGIGSPPAFRIRVVNQQGQPIPNAMVSMVGLGLPTGKDTTTADATADNSVSLDYLTLNSPNQIGAITDPVLPPTQNPFACPPTDAYGPTDVNGYFQPVLNWDMIRGWLGKKVKMWTGYKEVYQTIPPTATFTIYVNALWQGYGTLDAQLHPQTFTRTIVYNNNTNRFYNLGGGSPIQADPITVTLPSLPPGATPDVPIVSSTDAPQKGTFNWFGAVYPVYGPLYSFSDLIGNPAVTYQETTLRVGLNHDPMKYGMLDEVRLFLDNVDKGAFATGSNPDCVGSTYYFFNVLNAHALTPGWHFLRIEAHPTGVITPTSRTLILEYVKLPAAATWFYDSSYKNRHVTWYAKFVDLSGLQLPAGQPASSSVLTATVPRVGYLENRAGADNWVSQRLDVAGSSKLNYSGGVQSKALNTSAPQQSTNQQVVGSNPIKFGSNNPIPILDTGWVPLFRDHWGLWPIASATIGADMAFKATLIYNGTITFNPSHSTLFVSPNATVNVKAWFDLSALFGVVKAGASAIPSIGVSMPVTFENGVKKDDDVCFKYKLDIEWYGKVGVCPLCKKKSGTKNIFNDYTPKTPLCAQAQLKMSAPSADTPPDTSPALAADGFGHTLAVWSDDNNDLKFKTYNGVSWSTSQTLIANQRSLAPKVAYFAPNQAIAVWSQNNLTLAQQQTASFTDTVRAQHLAYATWNGVTWSAPLTLTLPTTGEGGVVLASCLSTTNGCPATGAATAVWIKDAVGELAQRQFRLFYATYQNGSWSAAQPIDAASTVTDSEPTLVYQGSVPLVVWVRDTDRDVVTIADRRLTYRLLNGSPIVIPNDLPTGIVEPSAAIDPAGNLKIAFTRVEDANAFTGNQRPLYSAAQACTPGCAWSAQKLQDNHGRALRAESPLLTIDPTGKSTITFRGLGFGPLPNGTYQSFPEDAIGMLTLTGELAQVEVDFASVVHSPFYLTNDGAVNWHPAVVFDSALNQINTIVIKGTAPALPLPLKVQHSATVRRPTMVTQNDAQVVFNAVPQQPDFVVAAVTPSKRYPELTDTISITVQLRNDGTTWQAGRTEHLDLLALWDGGAGFGILAGSTQLSELFSGQIVTVTLILTSPANLDVTHTLVVVVNPQQMIVESTAANNQLTTLIGGLPVPTDLSALAQTGNSLVYLNWTPSTDRRVVGYRIYRGQEGGPVSPIGSTFVAGYVDVGASLDHIYDYRVTSYSVDGVESGLSDALIVIANGQRVYLPLVRKN